MVYLLGLIVLYCEKHWKPLESVNIRLLHTIHEEMVWLKGLIEHSFKC